MYTFNQHLHNYALWTAARAAQRGFTTTENIKEAIEQTELQQLAEGKLNVNTKEAYDEFHRKTCGEIIVAFQSMKQLTKDIKDKATFGRAAKIVAIYLKTAVVIRDSGESNLSKIIHPPIDRILLTNLRTDYPQIKLVNWTQMNETEYNELWKQIKPICKDAYWKIEKYWSI